MKRLIKWWQTATGQRQQRLAQLKQARERERHQRRLNEIEQELAQFIDSAAPGSAARVAAINDLYSLKLRRAIWGI